MKVVAWISILSIFILVVVAVAVAIWLCWKKAEVEEEKFSAEASKFSAVVFLDPVHLAIALKRGHVKHSSGKWLPPFFHYVLQNDIGELSEHKLNKLRTEERWKGGTYLNLLWSTKDCKRICHHLLVKDRSHQSLLRDLDEVDKFNRIAKFIPMMLVGGVYHSADRKIPEKGKKYLKSHSRNHSNVKSSEICLTKDKSSGNIDENFFISTHLPRFWEEVIAEILVSRDKEAFKIIKLKARANKIRLVIL